MTLQIWFELNRKTAQQPIVHPYCFLVAQPDTFVYNSRKQISMGKKDKPTEQQSSADDPASESTDDDEFFR